jgi:cytochrome c oxidase cbb3-type subunit 3
MNGVGQTSGRTDRAARCVSGGMVWGKLAMRWTVGCEPWSPSAPPEAGKLARATKSARKRAAYSALCLSILLAACQREQRDFDPGPESESPVISLAMKRSYEQNAFALNQGKDLFSRFNCTGCHAHGGGGMGPALLDAKWRYGDQLEDIFKTIMDGRPNGMPAFRDKISPQQAWQIAGYVRSISGQLSVTTAPNRNDHMKANPPENSVDPVTPTKEPMLPGKPK